VLKYSSNTKSPWIMVRVEACSIVGMPKRSMLFTIKLSRLAQGDEHTEWTAPLKLNTLEPKWTCGGNPAPL